MQDLALITTFPRVLGVQLNKPLYIIRGIQSPLLRRRGTIKYIFLKIKSVAYSSQGSHTGQLHFCNWLVDGYKTG